MIPGDLSQLPVERLAQLLLQHARDDGSLPQRTAANDDDDTFGRDDMFSRIASLPTMQREEPVRLPPRLGADAADMEVLEGLVSLALTSAQDAEELSREAHEASRRTRRGMVFAIALSMLGIAVAAGSGSIRWWSDGSDSQMAAMTGQVPALGTLGHRVSDQLMAPQGQDALPDPAAGSAPRDVPVPSPAQDAPVASVARDAPVAPTAPPQPATQQEFPALPTQQVRVLPAHVAVPAAARAPESRPHRATTSIVAYSSVAWAPARPSHPAPILVRQSEHARPPRPIGYDRSPRAITWPAVYVITTVQRGIGALFR